MLRAEQRRQRLQALAVRRPMWSAVSLGLHSIGGARREVWQEQRTKQGRERLGAGMLLTGFLRVEALETLSGAPKLRQ